MGQHHSGHTCLLLVEVLEVGRTAALVALAEGLRILPTQKVETVLTAVVAEEHTPAEMEAYTVAAAGLATELLA